MLMPRRHFHACNSSRTLACVEIFHEIQPHFFFFLSLLVLRFAETWTQLGFPFLLPSAFKTWGRVSHLLTLCHALKSLISFKNRYSWLHLSVCESHCEVKNWAFPFPESSAMPSDSGEGIVVFSYSVWDTSPILVLYNVQKAQGKLTCWGWGDSHIFLLIFVDFHQRMLLHPMLCSGVLTVCACTFSLI